jgi:hypothetical protein
MSAWLASEGSEHIMTYTMLRKPVANTSRERTHQRKPESHFEPPRPQNWRERESSTERMSNANYYDLTPHQAPQALAKFEIGDANDSREQEADAIANRVMRMPTAAAPGKVGPPSAAKEPFGFQSAFTDETRGLPSTIGADIRRQHLGGGRTLDVETRNFMEQRFARDLDSIRVHTGTTANE